MTKDSQNDNSNFIETFEFQAEIQKLLDILINRLYKNREIFLRELISNAADALHKLRVVQFDESRTILDPEAELSIRILFDEDEGTITVSDTGYGMTYKEIVTNLGTIAQSGTLEFLKDLNETSDVSNFIGMFGVGFYSSFIVAKEVVVRSRTYSQEGQGVEWRSTGTGEFQVKNYDKTTRGTDVVLYLKEDMKSDFLNKYKLENIIKKYSDFVGFPIRIGDDDEIINRQVPIWHQAEEEVSDEEYNEFYRQVSFDYTEPFHRIHLSVDAPIQFRALIFLPKHSNRAMMTSLYQDYGLRLYSKKILVQEKAKDLLPEYLRFVFGVVDSEDLPLNVSREVIQVDQTIRRISKVIVSKILDELEKMIDEHEEKYLEWWNEFGVFIKEGITADEKRRKKLLNLLRVKTYKSESKLITLKSYLENLSEQQEEIFYLLGENIKILQNSPHLEPYKKNQQDVILFDEPIDSFVMMNVVEFEGKKFKAIDQAEPELPPPEDEKKEDKSEEEKKEEKDDFLKKMSEILGDRIIDIQYTDLLTESPCRLVNPTGMGAFSRAMRYMDQNFTPNKKILEINPNNSLIKEMKTLFNAEPNSVLFEMCVNQLLENQEITDGTLQDPVKLVNRITQFMLRALEKK
ncbi:MAG: molecular chaperone HtpG [Candidatus Heimdallarchaeota archaeon]|nr:molecular chaperone HtpG [Candidatus Heimdallarchaeota archaeon]